MPGRCKEKKDSMVANLSQEVFQNTESKSKTGGGNLSVLCVGLILVSHLSFHEHDQGRRDATEENRRGKRNPVEELSREYSGYGMGNAFLGGTKLKDTKR